MQGMMWGEPELPFVLLLLYGCGPLEIERCGHLRLCARMLVSTHYP